MACRMPAFGAPQGWVRRLIFVSAGVAAITTASPSPAQMRAEDVINLGIQLLQEAERQKAPQAQAPQRQAPQRQAPQVQSPQTRQAAPAPRVRIPRSDAVVEAQRRLNELGYGAGDVDGQAGPQTRRAIAQFQRDHGLPETGAADAAFLDALRQGAVASPAPSAAPAVRLSAVPQSIEILDGMDLPGGDYRSGLQDPAMRGIGVEACAQACADDAICQGFTYNKGAAICILKDMVSARAQFAGAVSGIRTGGATATATVADTIDGLAPVVAADFVHMALMSDTEAYLAQAPEAGINYIRATGNEAQCKALYDAEKQDEFARRDAMDRAAEAFREVVASLPSRPRRVQMPLEASYSLGEYDFDRQGFPIKLNGHQGGVPVLAAGIVPLMDAKRHVSCRAAFGWEAIESSASFDNLGAEHGGAPGVDFLPMPQEEARGFRTGGNNVLIRATMVVEPRDQGRGPLKGQITGLTAHDPNGGRLLHRWDAPAAAPEEATPDAAAPLSGELLAALIAPVVEPRISEDALDNAATRYFGYHRAAIDRGNPPPQSPLPIEAMRGQEPAVIASLNRARLREVLRENQPLLPVAVTAEEQVGTFYDEDKGVHFSVYGSGLSSAEQLDPLTEVELSDRDLQLYGRLISAQNWQAPVRQGFREAVIANQSRRMLVEFDRLMRLDPVEMSIEAAAERGLVGNSSGRRRDSVIIRWNLELTEVRATDDAVIISASVRGLSYHWASDNALLAEFPPEHFPTVAALRMAAEAALPPLATAESVATPPAGARWGAEMADLLMLRFAPETVDDREMERMMLTRLAYEAAMAEGEPDWGRFFRDPQTYPSAEERSERLGAFRAWSEARAAALPERVTLWVPMDETADGLRAAYENRGRPQHALECAQVKAMPEKGAREADLALDRVCAFLDAAWQTPEPLLFLRDGVSHGASRDLRYDCEADAYCTAMYNARVEMKLPHDRGSDIIRLDRLPVIDAALRDGTGRLFVEIEAEPTGASVATSFPESIWRAALRQAGDHATAHGVRIHVPQVREQPVNLFEAKAVSARLVDRGTGAVIADLPLAAPVTPAPDMLAVPESRTAGLDLLGIRLGMSFAEADGLIREHMEVGKVLTADRSRQLSAASGKIVPYTSGRIYASAAGDELIAIFDEPPAASETVLGAWRILRLPRGSTDPAGLQAALAEHYGQPSSVEEVGLPFMNKGVAYYWLDAAHEDCESIPFDFQTDLWHDETGASWLPPFMTQPLFPVLNHASSFDGVNDEPRPSSSFCPAFLGVRYATYDGSDHGAPAGDELVTWLSDNRAYAAFFYESRQAPEPNAAPPGGAAQIKF